MQEYVQHQREKWEHDHPQAAKDKEHQYQKGAYHPILGYEDLMTCEKQRVGVDQLTGKYLGFYFSANWSRANTDFTPVLVSAYEEYNRTCPRNKKLEIIFVSSDASEEDMWKYVTSNKMPWSILPFNDHRKNNLMGRFHVNQLPKLVVVDPKGNSMATDLLHESIVENIEMEGATFFSKVLGHSNDPMKPTEH